MNNDGPLDLSRVIPAPEWLRKSHERLRAEPSPTLDEVQRTFEASARLRAQYIAKEKQRRPKK
jgi:hypothetical protein